MYVVCLATDALFCTVLHFFATAAKKHIRKSKSV